MNELRDEIKMCLMVASIFLLAVLGGVAIGLVIFHANHEPESKPIPCTPTVMYADEAVG